MNDNLLRKMSDAVFANYLEQVAADLEESGMTSTAEDYREMVRRLRRTDGVGYPD